MTIHPFEDGNGRIARAIADMALARSEGSAQRFYSMSARIRRERGEYYAMLERTQKGGLDITGWLDWFLGCLDRAFDGTEEVLGHVLHKARFWEAMAGEIFSERQRAVCQDRDVRPLGSGGYARDVKRPLGSGEHGILKERQLLLEQQTRHLVLDVLRHPGG